MKRKVLIGLVVALAFLGVRSLNAQSGYKDYMWGMTVEQVKKKCPTLKYDDHAYFNTPRFAFYYLYRDEIKPEERSSPLSYEEREITAYYAGYTQGQSISASINEFYFVDGKLIAVELTFAGEPILEELERQYGKVQPIHHVEGIMFWDAVAWRDRKQRYIVWVTSNYALEYVTYIDEEWLAPLLDKAIADYRQEREGARSILDF